MSEDKEQDFYPEYNDMTIAELAQAQVDVKNEIEALKASTSLLDKRFDDLRLHRIPDKMEETGILSVKLDGIGRLSMQGNLHASILKDKKEEAYDWLQENGHGDLIKGTVNASTLKAFIKECMKNGEAYPDELFKVSPYMMATITKG